MIRQEIFGTMPSGEKVYRYIMTNASGNEASVIDYGATIHRVRVKDKTGELRDTTLSYETLEGYLADNCYLGACVGPHANRIAGAQMPVNGTLHELQINDGPNNLHSGSVGWGKRVWKSTVEGGAVVMRTAAPDGEGGFPGNRTAVVRYHFTDDNTLTICYEVETDADTVLNMTNHSYFNLGANKQEHIFLTELKIDADAVTEAGPGLIPTGKITPVEGTPFDFRQAKRIGQDAFRVDGQLALGQGYDHNFVLNGSGYRVVAEAYEPNTGIFMEVLTEEPGIQLYAGNCMGAPFAHNTGFCLETQHYPDSVHHENFPPVITKAGETYRTKTGYRFSVR